MSDIERDTASGKLMDTLADRLHRDVREKADRIGEAVDISGKNFENPERRAAWDEAMRPLFDHYERGHQGPANRIMERLDGDRLFRTGKFAAKAPDTDDRER